MNSGFYIVYLESEVSMPSFYTKSGDDGTTGLLGEGRVPKFDLRPETLGTLDEAAAALGLARAATQSERVAAIILQTQRDLYMVMAEVAATPENTFKFRTIGPQHTAWLEDQIDKLSQEAAIPKEFIVSGDSLAGAMLDLARTVVRRAERRLAELVHRGDIENPELLHYLNRLSSLCFVLELFETQVVAKSGPTLAKANSNIPGLP